MNGLLWLTDLFTFRFFIGVYSFVLKLYSVGHKKPSPHIMLFIFICTRLTVLAIYITQKCRNVVYNM